MKRRVVSLQEVRKAVAEFDPELANDMAAGICALVSVSNMGFCKDGKTRWYHFNLGDEPCVFFKR